jgi:endoglucanase
MKGILLPGLMFGLVTLVNVIIPFRDAPGAFPIPLQAIAVEFGVYDPHGQLVAERDIGIEHVFIDWNTPPERTVAALRTVEGHGRALMVTLEPFPRAGQDSNTYVRDLLAGEYDGLLHAHCEALSQASGRLFLRFAHEMDLVNGRYAWSGLSADSYIAIYRHAISVCRSLIGTFTAVWSPAGNTGLAKYYPGDAFVDMVGLSLFGLQPWEEITYGRSRRFTEALAEKYSRIEGFGKPVTIAEFGVCGTAVYRAQWLTDAMRSELEEFPLLQSLIYFNERETFRWPSTIGLRPSSVCDVEYPDWRLGE